MGAHTVVEAAGVPHPVVAAAASMEIHGIRAIKHVDAVIGVLGGVRVHNVHEHKQAQAMCLINQELQLIRGSKATGRLRSMPGAQTAADLIPQRCWH